MTEPLLPQDPSSIGGHRLLARLGAGGMGVVYLARAESGALAAVKVIQAEHADTEDFRTRFRREADAARRVHSPWAVPVTGADLDADQPWLATAFVPGPALQEAVMACGPLPVHSVRVLAKMLAGALDAVHAAGLVHRDIKPGNVLLAVDGPRLIDFGIARSLDDTALTSADLVIGTPGFLAPEQARADGVDLGPASDIFSLGCLLAYAVTGRPPFGFGAPDALLYRTVHGEPDLAGIADEAATGGAPAPSPGVPSAEGGPGGAGRDAGQGPRALDPRVAFRSAAGEPHADPGPTRDRATGADPGPTRDRATHADPEPTQDSATGADRGNAADTAGRAPDSTTATGEGTATPAQPMDAPQDIRPTPTDPGPTPTPHTPAQAQPQPLAQAQPQAQPQAPTTATPAPEPAPVPATPAQTSAPTTPAAALLALLRRCLAKDPAERPTAAEVAAAFSEDLPDGTADWLPPQVVRMIADRSTAMLALPDIERTLATPSGPVPGRPAGRRRFLTLASGAAVLAAGGGVGLWAALAGGSGGTPAKPARRWTIGVQGDLSGPGRAVGRAQESGARLAVEQYNARGSRSFELTLRTSDDEGRQDRAAAAAQRIADDRDVLAVLASSGDRTTDAALPVYDGALIPMVTVSNGQTLPEQSTSSMFLRARPTHTIAAAGITYQVMGLDKPPRRTGLIEDRGDETLAWMYSTMANYMFRQMGRPAYPRVVPASIGDGFGPVVDDMLDAGCDAFVYCGPSVGAARLARTLAERRFNGPRFAAEPALGGTFLQDAGEAAEGWTVTAGAIGPGDPRVRRFATAFRKRFDAAPGLWAVEAYDAVNLLIRELERAADGGKRPEPRALIEPLRAAKFLGVAKAMSFKPETGEYAASAGVYLHQVRNGEFHYVGPAPMRPPTVS
ncbi:ABC transporter substrate-binding protein [Streptomyces uncialis]|uniref:protein kinase domain-containing protein n=1 Tax=Streptomyces uncialis TaxID=1048205 RepID=UPI0037A6BE38